MNENLVSFTEKALEHVKKAVNSSKQGSGFRISIKKAGCSGYKYVPEIVAQPQLNDIVETESGVPVFIDSRWKNVIQGVQVDLLDKGLGQKQLIFINPNVSGECGCRESFNLPGEKNDDHHSH